MAGLPGDKTLKWGFRMRAMVIAVLLCLSAGCQGSRPERSEHERDSILGQSALPGAQGVRGALRASDSAATRNSRYDSVSGGQ